jgi:hypothetical protein
VFIILICNNIHLFCEQHFIVSILFVFYLYMSLLQYTVASVKDFVLQQWKLADLREMGQGCLPPNISGILKIVLPGKYALQVKSLPFKCSSNLYFHCFSN